jgi:hypothetical protein
MIVCQLPQILYFAPGKTGSTTVEHMLRDLGVVFDDDAKYRTNGIAKHVIPESFNAFDDYFVFMTCRNPYSRAVSMWSHFQTDLRPKPKTISILGPLAEASTGLDFKQWVHKFLVTPSKHIDHPFFNTQATYVASIPYIDAMIHQENLIEEWLQLPFVQAAEHKACRHERISEYRLQGKHWKDMYNNDTELIEAVNSAFEADFDAVGYSHIFGDAI